MLQPIVPSFFLYGEPPQDVADRFLHIEALDDRSRPNHWTIRAHAHAALNQIFFLVRGGGSVQAESVPARFRTPCVLMIPARIIHAFRFDEDTSGSVLTVSETLLRQLLGRDPELVDLFGAPRLLEFAPADDDGQAIRASLERLGRELARRAPGHIAAVESQLQAILVALLRLQTVGRAVSNGARARPIELVGRFRRLLERDFQSHHPLADYARALGISTSRLRAVCLEVTHRSPLQLIQDRLLLEAKQVLLFSGMSITKTAYHLGFEDPAYFSRFFTKSCGASPREFRRRSAILHS